jgi:hypothetical protein
MSVSFGLAKKIIEHPSYNLGLALPFVAAFYLLNNQQPVILPVFNYALGEQLSMVIKIISVAFFYVLFLFFFVLAGGLSKLTTESKLYLAYPILVLVVTVFAFFTQDSAPRFNLFFGSLSLAFLLLAKFDEGNLSLLLVGAVGTLVSLLSFVAGVLWFEGHFAFAPAIGSLFGFTVITPESLKIGWPMLITIGYVVFYAVFQTSELWSDS